MTDLRGKEGAMKVLEKELKIYEQNKTEFEKDHKWEWVVIHGEEVVGFYEDFQDAARTAVERFGRGPYLIKEVGVPKPSLPASVLYHPISV